MHFLIYESETREEAVIRFGSFCDKWESIERKVVKHFRKDFSKTLTFYEYAEDRRFISTTNHMERDLEEIRCRIKTQGYFKNERSMNLWVYGILKYEWLYDSNLDLDCDRFNRELTEWLIEYNFNSSHETLDYLTPMEHIENELTKIRSLVKVLPMWLARTYN